MPIFGTYTEPAYVAQLRHKLGRLFPRIIRFVSKKQNTSEEHQVHTQVSKMQCSFVYGSSGTVVVSSRASFVMAKWHSNEVVSTNMHHIFWTHNYGIRIAMAWKPIELQFIVRQVQYNFKEVSMGTYTKLYQPQLWRIMWTCWFTTNQKATAGRDACCCASVGGLVGNFVECEMEWNKMEWNGNSSWTALTYRKQG